MKINLQTPTEDVQVQLIPFIDVIFCILTFFILAALQFTRQQAINVDLPTAKSSTAVGSKLQQQRQILPVTIDSLGQAYIEKNPVQRQQLEAILKDYVKKNPNGILVLNASRSATYNDVIQMLDLLRQVGGDHVELATLPSPSDQSTNFPSQSPGYPAINSNVPQTAPLTNPSTSGVNNPNLYLPPINNQVPLPAVPPTQPQIKLNSVSPQKPVGSSTSKSSSKK